MNRGNDLGSLSIAIVFSCNLHQPFWWASDNSYVFLCWCYLIDHKVLFEDCYYAWWVSKISPWFKCIKRSHVSCYYYLYFSCADSHCFVLQVDIIECNCHQFDQIINTTIWLKHWSSSSRFHLCINASNHLSLSFYFFYSHDVFFTHISKKNHLYLPTILTYSLLWSRDFLCQKVISHRYGACPSIIWASPSQFTICWN